MRHSFRRGVVASTFASSCLLAAACTSSSSSPDAGAAKFAPGDGGGAIAVSPSVSNVLTCSSVAFTASIDDAPATNATWSVTPSTGAGTIDASGTYHAPSTAPTPPTANVMATSTLLTTASEQLTLATAFPGSPAFVGGSAGRDTGHSGSYQHQYVSNGDRVYAAWTVSDSTASTTSLMIARSDDGGVTWKPGAAAMQVSFTDGYTNDTSSGLGCPAIAVDPVNPDVVYAVGTVGSHNTLSASVGDQNDDVLGFSVSTDGGATFKASALLTGTARWTDCADITAPAANTVVVESPSSGCSGDPNNAPPPDMYIFSDSARGAGFTSGTSDVENIYTANGLTNALDILVGDATCLTDIKPWSGGSNNSSGQATESPRVFDDGAGRLCVTYVGQTPWASPNQFAPYVQCSSDAGAHFSAPLALEAPSTTQHNQPAGALGPNKAAAVAWNLDDGSLYVATSTDAGATFGTPVKVATYNGQPSFAPSVRYDATGILWLSYGNNSDGQGYWALVDKSCDAGATWSGPVLVNPAPAPSNFYFDSLLATKASAPVLMANGDAQVFAVSLAP